MRSNPPVGLRILIVDDERPARRKVRRFVEGDSDVEVVFEAPSGPRAVEVIRDEAPDIVFLDIQMPGLDGFGVLESLPPEAVPHVVFVTAFDEHAVRAFEVSAVDYLLKPFDRERFGRAFTRAKRAVRRLRSQEESERVLQVLWQVGSRRANALERLLVDAGNRSVMLRVDEIDRLEAARNYVRIHAGGQIYRLRATISNLDRQLDSRRFVRLNRSTIVNADRIVELEPAGHGDYQVRLRDGASVRLSRRYRDRLSSFTSS